jgi:hypothetical protein
MRVPCSRFRATMMDSDTITVDMFSNRGINENIAGDAEI